MAGTWDEQTAPKDCKQHSAIQSSRESTADKEISQEQASPWTWMLQGMVIPLNQYSRNTFWGVSFPFSHQGFIHLLVLDVPLQIVQLLHVHPG